jgi:hypothetical protein
VSPPNQTDFPPAATAQEAQSVVLRSKAVRAEVCWQGRQLMRAVMLSPGAGTGAAAEELLVEEETEMRFEPEAVGERVMSMSCHQSSSTAFLMPLSWNHCFDVSAGILELGLRSIYLLQS